MNKIRHIYRKLVLNNRLRPEYIVRPAFSQNIENFGINGVYIDLFIIYSLNIEYCKEIVVLHI